MSCNDCQDKLKLLLAALAQGQSITPDTLALQQPRPRLPFGSFVRGCCFLRPRVEYCPKCGDRGNGLHNVLFARDATGEYLDKRCKRCGFSWEEHTAS